LEFLANSLALCSDRIVTPDGVMAGAVLVDDEVITDIVDRGRIPASFLRVEYAGKVIMPGLVDTHVHINEPGRTEWEGFETATRSAAAGGITTLVDMPLNSSPVTTTIEAFRKKLDASRGKLYVDCGFHAGLVPENSRDIKDLLEAGVLGVKAFLTDSGIDEFQNVTEKDLRDSLTTIAKSGLPLLVHAELATTGPGLRSQPRMPYHIYLSSRPREWEHHAIKLLIQLCREFECHIHIVHLSSADAVPMLREARKEGLPITVETCPHYLFFSAEEIMNGDTRFKCAPPIREKENRERLWAALKEGVVTCVVSDHSPCPPEMKQLTEGDFQKSWGGIPSLQFGLSIVWTEARRRGHDLSELAEWMSHQPARLAGLEGKKGLIAPGHDADLVVWDPESTINVRQGEVHHRHKITPYEGRVLQGKVLATFLRGRKVYEDGQMYGPFGTTLLRHQLKKVPAWSN